MSKIREKNAKESSKKPMPKIFGLSFGQVLLVALILDLLIIFGIWQWLVYKPGPLQQPHTMVIKSGSSVGGVAYRLNQTDVIGSSAIFKMAMTLSGKQKHLKAGEYTFQPQASVKDVMEVLTKGATVQRMVTFPEGLTVADILAKIETLGLEGDVPADIQEGMLYPDTYAYQYGDTSLGLIQRMQERMRQELNGAWLNRDLDTPLKSPEELLILASIVEKESSVAAERSRVAGVFINRLRKGMKLQSDPTVIYGASDYDGDIKTFHLREDHPYNTYVHKGLPPTAIAVPSRDSLQATAQPEAHDYFYFVADGTGAHVFAKTYREHLANVEAYLRQRKEAK